MSNIKQFNVIHQYMKLLTYNVWSDSHQANIRFQEAKKLLQESSADIICLQELTPSIQSDLLQQEWVKDYYISTSVTSLPNGELMLSKYPIINRERFKFTETCTNRLINVMDISVPINEIYPDGNYITVITAQLEPLDHNSEYRREQFNGIMKILHNKNNAFLLCDMNMTEKESPVLMEEWLDAWVESGSSPDTQYTFDSEKNGNINGYQKCRYDRIIYRSNKWRIKNLDLLGVKPIENISIKNMQPSNHFGLLATMELVE